jgi:hypothetical protein
MRKITICTLLGALLLAAQEQDKPGTERWSIKTSIPDAAKLDRSTAVDLSELLVLPDAHGVTKNEQQYQSARIPAVKNARFSEGDVIRTTGWLHLVAGETDGDYHIQISNSPESGSPCLIVEVPNPNAPFTSSAELRPLFTSVRDFIKTRLLAGKDPAPGGSIMKHQVYVTVTGILFYDDSHVGDPPRGKRGMKAGTLWELHPVTAIVFAPKPPVATSAAALR